MAVLGAHPGPVGARGAVAEGGLGPTPVHRLGDGIARLHRPVAVEVPLHVRDLLQGGQGGVEVHERGPERERRRRRAVGADGQAETGEACTGPEPLAQGEGRRGHHRHGGGHAPDRQGHPARGAVGVAHPQPGQEHPRAPEHEGLLDGAVAGRVEVLGFPVRGAVAVEVPLEADRPAAPDRVGVRPRRPEGDLGLGAADREAPRATLLAPHARRPALEAHAGGLVGDDEGNGQAPGARAGPGAHLAVHVQRPGPGQEHAHALVRPRRADHAVAVVVCHGVGEVRLAVAVEVPLHRHDTAPRLPRCTQGARDVGIRVAEAQGEAERRRRRARREPQGRAGAGEHGAGLPPVHRHRGGAHLRPDLPGGPVPVAVEARPGRSLDRVTRETFARHADPGRDSAQHRRHVLQGPLLSEVLPQAVAVEVPGEVGLRQGHGRRRRQHEDGVRAPHRPTTLHGVQGVAPRRRRQRDRERLHDRRRRPHLGDEAEHAGHRDVLRGRTPRREPVQGRGHPLAQHPRHGLLHRRTHLRHVAAHVGEEGVLGRRRHHLQPEVDGNEQPEQRVADTVPDRSGGVLPQVGGGGVDDDAAEVAPALHVRGHVELEEDLAVAAAAHHEAHLAAARPGGREVPEHPVAVGGAEVGHTAGHEGQQRHPVVALTRHSGRRVHAARPMSAHFSRPLLGAVEADLVPLPLQHCPAPRRPRRGERRHPLVHHGAQDRRRTRAARVAASRVAACGGLHAEGLHPATPAAVAAASRARFGDGHRRAVAEHGRHARPLQAQGLGHVHLAPGPHDECGRGTHVHRGRKGGTGAGGVHERERRLVHTWAGVGVTQRLGGGGAVVGAVAEVPPVLKDGRTAPARQGSVEGHLSLGLGGREQGDGAGLGARGHRAGEDVRGPVGVRAHHGLDSGGGEGRLLAVVAHARGVGSLVLECAVALARRAVDAAGRARDPVPQVHGPPRGAAVLAEGPGGGAELHVPAVAAADEAGRRRAVERAGELPHVAPLGPLLAALAHAHPLRRSPGEGDGVDVSRPVRVARVEVVTRREDGLGAGEDGGPPEPPPGQAAREPSRGAGPRVDEQGVLVVVPVRDLARHEVRGLAPPHHRRTVAAQGRVPVGDLPGAREAAVGGAVVVRHPVERVSVPVVDVDVRPTQIVAVVVLVFGALAGHGPPVVDGLCQDLGAVAAHPRRVSSAVRVHPEGHVDRGGRGHVRLDLDGARPVAAVAAVTVGVEGEEQHPVAVRSHVQVRRVRPDNGPTRVRGDIAHLDQTVGGGSVGRVQDPPHVGLAGLVVDAVAVGVAVTDEDVAVRARHEPGLPRERPPSRRPHEHVAAVAEENPGEGAQGGQRHLGVAAHAHGGVLGAPVPGPGQEHLTRPPGVRGEGDPAVAVQSRTAGELPGVVAVAHGPEGGDELRGAPGGGRHEDVVHAVVVARHEVPGGRGERHPGAVGGDRGAPCGPRIRGAVASRDTREGAGVDVLHEDVTGGAVGVAGDEVRRLRRERHPAPGRVERPARGDHGPTVALGAVGGHTHPAGLRGPRRGLVEGAVGVGVAIVPEDVGGAVRVGLVDPRGGRGVDHQVRGRGREDDEAAVPAQRWISAVAVRRPRPGRDAHQGGRGGLAVVHEDAAPAPTGRVGATEEVPGVRREGHVAPVAAERGLVAGAESGAAVGIPRHPFDLPRVQVADVDLIPREARGEAAGHHVDGVGHEGDEPAVVAGVRAPAPRRAPVHAAGHPQRARRALHPRRAGVPPGAPGVVEAVVAVDVAVPHEHVQAVLVARDERSGGLEGHVAAVRAQAGRAAEAVHPPPAVTPEALAGRRTRPLDPLDGGGSAPQQEDRHHQRRKDESEEPCGPPAETPTYGQQGRPALPRGPGTTECRPAAHRDAGTARTASRRLPPSGQNTPPRVASRYVLDSPHGT